MPLFEGLAEHRLAWLAGRCSWRTVPAGRHVVSRHEDEGGVYFVAAGSVRATMYAASGRQVTFRDVGEGELFGDLAALDGRPRSVDVTTLADSVVAHLDRAGFLTLLDEEPAVSRRIMLRLVDLVRQLSERVIELSTTSVPHRVHAELLRLAQDAGVAGNEATLDPAPRHADLAAQVSTNREQVTRELSALTRQGLLRKSGKALVVADVERLSRLVDAARGGDPAT